jgi:hypothetical protein
VLVRFKGVAAGEVMSAGFNDVRVIEPEGIGVVFGVEVVVFFPGVHGKGHRRLRKGLELAFAYG